MALGIRLKRIKCLEINFTKEVQESYTKKYRTLPKEIREDLSGKTLCIHGGDT